MVAQERMKVADLEAELKESVSEREALKLAMKILEEENQQFRNVLAPASQAVQQVRTTTPTQRLTPSPSPSHSRHSSRSSLSVLNAIGSAPGSPRANPQCLTPVEPLLLVTNRAYPEDTRATVDLAERKEPVQQQPGKRSPPPPLEVDCWPDSPDTPCSTFAPPDAEPDEGETTARLNTQ